MKDRPDVEQDRRVRSPVGRHLEFIGFVAGLCRGKDQQAREGFAVHCVGHGVSMLFESSDDSFDRTREVGSAMPIREEVDVSARSVAHAVGADRVTASQRKPVIARDGQSDFRESTMAWFHATTPTPGG